MLLILERMANQHFYFMVLNSLNLKIIIVVTFRLL